MADLLHFSDDFLKPDTLHLVFLKDMSVFQLYKLNTADQLLYNN